MVWRLLKKLGIKPPYDPAIPLLDIYPGGTKTERVTCIPLFIAARMHAGERVPEKALWLLLLCFFFQSSSNERQGKSKCVNKTTKENVAGGFETGEY